MSAFDALPDWPSATAAAGVSDAQRTLAEAGPVDLVQPWASVTKLVTAYAVLRLVETGDIDLDEAAGPPGSTVRHLLAHASGLNIEGRTSIAAPGRRRVYSNGGYDIIGALVGERSGQGFADFVAAAVFEPLGMSASAIVGSASAGGQGSVRDLLAFARELLAPRLVDAKTMHEATTVQFAGLDGVLPGFGRQNPNDWGLGFELRDGKNPHWTGSANSAATFGHFGQLGSFLWVDRAAGIACVALTNTKFGEWAAQAWPQFADAVLAEFGEFGEFGAGRSSRQPTRPVM